MHGFILPVCDCVCDGSGGKCFNLFPFWKVSVQGKCHLYWLHLHLDSGIVVTESALCFAGGWRVLVFTQFFFLRLVCCGGLYECKGSRTGISQRDYRLVSSWSPVHTSCECKCKANLTSQLSFSSDIRKESSRVQLLRIVVVNFVTSTWTGLKSVPSYKDKP